VVQRQPERRLGPVRVADLGQGHAQAAGEAHVSVVDEPGQQLRGRKPVAGVEVGADQQVVGAGLARRDGAPQGVDGLVDASGVEQGGRGGGQPAGGGSHARSP
jgi:hypothetical protein